MEHQTDKLAQHPLMGRPGRVKGTREVVYRSTTLHRGLLGKKKGSKFFVFGTRTTSCNTICIYTMRYEWGEAKNRQNQQKHEGVSFELATLIFEDDRCLVGPDRIDETGEQRWHAIGTARIGPQAAAVLLVVHVYREDFHGEEIIRIISARRAEKHEIRRYEEQEMD